MVNDEKIIKKFLKLFLFEDLNKPIVEILKLLNLNHSTFYNHFFSYDNFIEKSLDTFTSHFLYKRKRMDNDNILKVINEINNLIFDEINKYKDLINLKIFSKNLHHYEEYLKKTYFHLILLNITSNEISYNHIKINLSILLEEAYFSLILHLKNNDNNLFEYQLVSM